MMYTEQTNTHQSPGASPELAVHDCLEEPVMDLVLCVFKFTKRGLGCTASLRTEPQFHHGAVPSV